METLSLEELQKKAKELQQKAKEQAIASQESMNNSQQYYLEIQKRQTEKDFKEIKKDIAVFRKQVDKFVETILILTDDMEALDKGVDNLQTKYGETAFTNDEKQLFYSMKLGAVFFKVVQSKSSSS